MKKTGFILLFATAAVLCVQAQRRTRTRDDGPRDIKIAILDTIGNQLTYLPVIATVNGSEDALFPRMDRLGTRYFRVRESDTLGMFVYGRFFRFPVAGIDSLAFTVRQPAGDSLNYIDPVRVTARRPQMIDTGFGKINPATYTGAGYNVDMKHAQSGTQSIIGYLQGRVPGLWVGSDGSVSVRGADYEPLIVMDGVIQHGTLNDVSGWIPIHDVESIFIIKGGTTAALYGMKGANGVIVITTKRGF